MVDFQFGNSWGWYAFFSLLVLVILYLVRPKPVERDIPSLMFFLRDRGTSRKSSFFRRLFSSLVFLLQLLCLALLALAITSPFTTFFGTSAIERTVIVLDGSASMQVPGRFQNALSAARQELNGEVSVVVAQNVPLLLLENGNREQALKVLSSVEPKDTGSDIGDAMLLGGDVIGERTGKVVVISDFISTEGPDPVVAKRSLLARGISVSFKDVKEPAKNAGIVDLYLGKFTSRAVVRNYDSVPRTVTLSVAGEKEVKKIPRKVLAGSVEVFEFSTIPGSSEISIDEKDDFEADNHAYISAPGIRRIKVLLVTNADRSFLKTALQASRDIELTVAEPPVIPDISHDVVILHSVSPDHILPDFYQEVREAVSNGSSLVITAQDNMAGFPADLLPVSLGPVRNNTRVSTVILNKFTSDVDFGTAFKFHNASARADTAVIADADGSAMLVLQDFGAGKVIYYGIIDEFSDFKTTVSYPIFWSKLINFLTETEDLADYNFRTGRVLADSSGKKYLDKAGFYNFGSKRVSASLLNARESDVSGDTGKVLEEARLLSAREGVEKRDVSFERLLILAAMLVLFLELLYIKWRGDF